MANFSYSKLRRVDRQSRSQVKVFAGQAHANLVSVIKEMLRSHYPNSSHRPQESRSPRHST